MSQKRFPLARVDLTEQQYQDLASSLDPGVAYFVGGALRSIGPSAVGGAGFTKNATTGLAETDVGGETFGALPLNAQGQAIGNIGHRRGTLASLIALAGLPGEISVPTDYRGFIVHNGVAGDAYYVGPDSYLIDVSNAGTPAQLNLPRGFFSVLVVGASVNANITALGGLQIDFGLDSTGNAHPPRGKISLLVDAPFEAGGLAVQLSSFVVDFTGATAGKNYFEWMFDARLVNAAVSPIVAADLLP